MDDETILTCKWDYTSSVKIAGRARAKIITYHIVPEGFRTPRFASTNREEVAVRIVATHNLAIDIEERY